MTRILATLLVGALCLTGCSTTDNDPDGGYRSPYEGALTVPSGPGSAMDRLQEEGKRRPSTAPRR